MDIIQENSNGPKNKDVNVTSETVNNNILPKDKDINIPSQNILSKPLDANDNCVSPINVDILEKK